MKYRVLPLLLAVAVLALLVGGPGQAEEKKAAAAGHHYFGRVESVNSTTHEVTIMGFEVQKGAKREKGAKPQTFTFKAGDAKVSHEGQASTLSGLKKGDRVGVTTKQDGSKAATEIHVLPARGKGKGRAKESK